MARTSNRFMALMLGFLVTACGPNPLSGAHADQSGAVQAFGKRFNYDPPRMIDVKAARHWVPGSRGLSGIEANRAANETYHTLDGVFSRYLGGPELSNWLTFGKYASREVGGQIRSMESALEILHTLKSVDFSLKNDREALQALTKMMSSDVMLDQAVRIALGIRNDMDVCAQFEWLCLRPPRPGGISLTEGVRRLKTFLPVMRASLVEGNTEVYRRITTAYDVFLRAEGKGDDGVAALKAAAQAGTVHDPLGYLVEAFALYKQARGLTLEAEGSPDRRQLLERRWELVRKANLLLAIQEQGPILQDKKIFGDPRVAQLTGALSGRMYLTLYRQGSGYNRFRMLPDGGNWANYADRMGFREASASAPDSYRVVLPGESSPRYFSPDPQKRGTIYDLFEKGLDGTVGQALRDGRPRELSEGYTHQQPWWKLALGWDS